MNYYPHHIGDYMRDTAHLSMLEDAAYRRMLDLYYANERPLPGEKKQLYRLLRANSDDERCAVDVVLDEFFSFDGELCAWRNKRADIEIQRSQEKSEKARTSAGKRWQSDGNANAQRRQSEGNAPNNQKPIAKGKSRGDAPPPAAPAAGEPDGDTAKANRGTRIDRHLGNRTLPSEWAAFCTTERPDLDPQHTFNRFFDHWIAQPGQKGVKLDWPATWRNWCRNEKRAPGAPPGPSTSAPTAITCKRCSKAITGPRTMTNQGWVHDACNN